MAKGQGLIEIIIALGVMVTGLTAVLAISSNNLAVGRDSERRVIAANLAREGIELVRNVRDSNRLANLANPLHANLESGTDYTAVAFFDTTAFVWSLNFSPNSFSDISTSAPSTLVYRSGNFYVQAASQPAGSSVSLFKRLLTLNPICKTSGVITSGSACGVDGGSDEKIGIQILSQVSWTSGGGRAGQITVEDRLYKW